MSTPYHSDGFSGSSDGSYSSDGFSGDLEDPGQLDWNSSGIGLSGSADPLSTFAQYSQHPYSNINAWDPKIDPNSSSNATIPPGPSYSPPDLEMVVESPPDYAALPVAGDSSGNSGTPNTPAVTIDLNSLWQAESQITSNAIGVVALYKTLNNLFQDTKDWIFGQQAEDPISPITPETNPANTGLDIAANVTGPWTNYATGDAVNASAQAFAGTDGHPGMNDMQASALVQIANGMELVGRLLAMMQKAGVAYATGDNASIFPSAQTSGN